MNTTDILQTLHGLAAEDRAWIIARLPARAKAQLLGEKAQVDEKPQTDARVPTDIVPNDVDASRLAAVLAEEPSWIVAVVLDGAAEPWAAAVLERRQTGMRADIATVQRTGCSLTPHARQVLIRTVLARVGCGASTPVRSGFQQLLARLSASRSRKRLTIHL